jgi:FAD/FMN-containing dehydrogenase
VLDLTPLINTVAGPVLTPSDGGFAEEVSGYNLAISHRPDVVVGVTSADDAAAAVRFAADNGLRVTVLATGHGSHTAVEGGMLITTRRLDALSIDQDTRIATIGAGLSWAPVVAAAAELGLAPITGSSATVGVVGYLLGGGLGPLSRSHGFSSDYIRAFTVITPSGELVEASAEQNADLFWALRGGKGGFGLVTEVRLELVPLASLYAGALVFAEEHIETAVRAWLDYTLTAQDDVTTSVSIIRFPPVELVPEPFRGRTLAMVRFAYPGDSTTGERLVAPLRGAAPVYLDGVREMSPADVALIHSDPPGPVPSWNTGLLLNQLDQDFLNVYLGFVGSGAQTPVLAAELRHLGGATGREVAGGSAVGGRDAAYSLVLIGAPDPSLFAEVLPAATGAVIGALQRWVAPLTNINFSAGAEYFDRAWPAPTFERLAGIRASLDPDGVFAYGPHTA